MYELFKKYWKRFFLPLKIGIVFAAFYVIYAKINIFKLAENQFTFPVISIYWFVFFVFMMLLMSSLNWLLEIYKWKLLVSTFKPISFFDSLIQSLSAHTVALFTPFKSGDFGMKTMYYERSLFKKIIGLNFLGNLSQLLVTFIFGILGLYFYQYSIVEIFDFSSLFTNKWIVFYGLLGILMILLFSIVTKKYNFFKIVSLNTHLQNFGIAFLRYFIFSHQFLLLLYIFKPELDYLQTISAIFSLYLLASIIPTLALFDWVIKGSMAVLLLSVLGFHGEAILLASLWMWIFNFALPAVLGSYFVLTFPSAQIIANE
ncbi:MAG: hypothetical protein NDI80_05165 [Flavobacteriaceae bacterium]|nr:hypothetical protein [Flavobacteriaceae bacterium]